jgi:hypothetical protein
LESSLSCYTEVHTEFLEQSYACTSLYVPFPQGGKESEGEGKNIGRKGGREREREKEQSTQSSMLIIFFPPEILEIDICSLEKGEENICF